MNSRKKKFFSYYKPYLKLLIADLACAFLVSVTTLALPLCTRYITKSISEGQVTNTLNLQIQLMGVFMLGLLLIHVVSRGFVDYQGHMMGAKMESDVRRELFDHYQKLSFSFYDEQRTGQLMTRISHDSLELSELFHHGPEDIVISTLNFLGAFIILATVNQQLAMILFLILVTMGFYAFHFNKKMNIAMKRSKDRIGDINTQVEDTLAGIRVVKSFTNEEIERKKFTRENNRFVESRKDVYKSESYFFGGMTGFTQLMSIAVIILGSIKIFHNSMDLSDLVTFLFCVGIIIEPINRFSNFAKLYQEGITSFERIMEVLEIKPDTTDILDEKNAYKLDSIRGEIEFRNVNFKYKEDHDYVIKNISLKIKSGECIALVGASGVGKTTLCSLIPRFYEINDGIILLDGVNIKEISLKALRQSIGVVHQDGYLFSGTVSDNIRFGNLNSSEQDVIEAAKKANAHEFIMSLSNGYETNIGQRGVRLSGGQKQRLSIARVFLKNPPIIIFDEATSALDNESERAVQKSMEKLSTNRTTLVIAHRLSTVRNASRIIVLTENGIGEQGTHHDLIGLNGIYAKLYNMNLII